MLDGHSVQDRLVWMRHDDAFVNHGTVRLPTDDDDDDDDDDDEQRGIDESRTVRYMNSKQCGIAKSEQ